MGSNKTVRYRKVANGNPLLTIISINRRDWLSQTTQLKEKTTIMKATTSWRVIYALIRTDTLFSFKTIFMLISALSPFCDPVSNKIDCK